MYAHTKREAVPRRWGACGMAGAGMHSTGPESTFFKNGQNLEKQLVECMPHRPSQTPPSASARLSAWYAHTLQRLGGTQRLTYSDSAILSVVNISLPVVLEIRVGFG